MRAASSARGGLVIAATAVAFLASGRPAQALKLTECQHPVLTGVEVYRLHNVNVATACRVALSLFRWEAKPGNHVRLYRCTSLPGRPILKLHSFGGWALHIARSGDFVMSRPQQRSFDVGGTDFPLNCS
jgi:hypothetical protein